MKMLFALTVLAVTMVGASTAYAGAKSSTTSYQWSKMTLTQTVHAQRTLIILDWKKITTWRVSRWVKIDGFNDEKFVDKPMPNDVSYALAHMKWTKRELRESLRALKQRGTGPLSGSGSFAIDSCTKTLLSREGGMNPHSVNPYSGAYGGPQALPGSKMASAGSDWHDNIWTQIRWMIGYMNGRYGSSCSALAHSYATGWY